MNSFDVVVYLVLIVAVVVGFRAGLLRSAATILGYLLAMPLALWIAALLGPRVDTAALPSLQGSLLLLVLFVVCGVALGTLLRMAVNEIVGERIGVGDRLAGAALGAARVFLIAVTMVLIFDELIPANRQPAYLAGSQLRPLLSVAGQRCVRSLPPDVAAYIDQLKRTHRI